MDLATDRLKQEHQLIDRFLGLLKRAMELDLDGRTAFAEVFARLHQCGVDFIDLYHFAKEESYLYKTFLRISPPDAGGPVELLLNEHVWCRRFFANLSMGLELYKSHPDRGRNMVLEAAESFIDTLSNHLFKEETLFFVMADQVFSAELHEEIVTNFNVMDLEAGDGNSLDQFTRQLDAIEKILKSSQ